MDFIVLVEKHPYVKDQFFLRHPCHTSWALNREELTALKLKIEEALDAV